MTDTRATAAPVARNRSWTTLWYYVVVVLSFGMFTAIPFAHAATRLWGRPAGRWCALSAVFYTAVFVVAVVCSSSPTPAVGGGIAFAGIALACAHLTAVRFQVARAGRRVVDPSVAAVLDSRRHRDRARAIVASDPAMARELRIGRPDLPRTFDDGGLVDLNSAPAAVIADVCGLDADTAGRLVTARTAAGAPFVRVDDAFTYSDVPVALWERIRERAVVVP